MNQRRNGEYALSYYAIAMVILAGLIALIANRSSGVGQDNNSLLFFMVPGSAFCAMRLGQGLIRRFLAGRFTPMLEAVVTRFGGGIMIFLAFLFIPDAKPLRMVGFAILALTFVYTLQTVNAFLTHYFVLNRILQSVVYILQAVIYGMVCFSVWKGGIWDMGMDVSAGVMVIAGFLTLYACALLSLFELSETRRMKALGRWMVKDPVQKFLFACGMVFVFKDLRAVIKKNFPEDLVIGEWILLFIILLVTVFFLFKRIKTATEEVPARDLRKHIQDIEYFKGTDLDHMAAVIQQFIQEGEKSRVCTILILAAGGGGLPIETTMKMVKPLIDYKDIPMPGFCLRREMKRLEQRNRENRRAVLERTLQQLTYLGRERNEYGRNTG